jgi:hypothetical protein
VEEFSDRRYLYVPFSFSRPHASAARIAGGDWLICMADKKYPNSHYENALTL